MDHVVLENTRRANRAFPNQFDSPNLMNAYYKSKIRFLLKALTPHLALGSTLLAQSTGPSSSQSAYFLPSNTAWKTTSLLTTGDAAGTKADGSPYRMVGIPDGLGAFDNKDGTFTVLMNHELGSSLGAVREHGSVGAFVSEWIIDKQSLQVVSGRDLIVGLNYTSGSAALNRFCSADLPAVTAFYNAATGNGTTERIFMNGEESGAEGRAFAHAVSSRQSYELPALGKFSWENSIANPKAQEKTIVMGNDDSTVGGQVYMYVGTKQATGNAAEKAGLTNGKLFGVRVDAATQSEDRTTGWDGAAGKDPSQRFGLVDLGNVANQTGAQLETQSQQNLVSNFLRPEDGAWDPENPNTYYFVTTDRLDTQADGAGNQQGNTRLYRMVFDDITNPENGGKLEMLIDGDGAENMFDNLTVSRGHVFIQEDPGNAAHSAKIWDYTIADGNLKEIFHADPARFGDIGLTGSLTLDEESSGIIDISDIINDGGRYLLFDVQNHARSSDPELVEGGQLVLARAVPEGGATTVAGLASLAILAGIRRRQTNAR